MSLLLFVYTINPGFFSHLISFTISDILANVHPMDIGGRVEEEMLLPGDNSVGGLVVVLVEVCLGVIVVHQSLTASGRHLRASDAHGM